MTIAQSANVPWEPQTWLGLDLSPGQLEIIDKFLDPHARRVIISACTRYGKTRACAVGVLTYILENPRKKVLIIAPSRDQARIMRDYIAEHIVECPELSELVSEAKGKERLRNEASRKRVTFKNGSEIQTLTAGGKLMGYGGDMIVLDQSEDIPDEIYRGGISRMLGDSPDSKLIEIINPWTRNHVWEHWLSDRFETVLIGWEQAVREGRHSKEWIDEQREELTEYEFDVLYNATFPAESKDSMFHFDWFSDAQERSFQSDSMEHIWGVDVAAGGADMNVLTYTQKYEGRVKIVDMWDWDEADTMKTVGKVQSIISGRDCDELRVDSIGIGKGVADRLGEKGLPVISVNVGEKPKSDKKRFLNLKAEGYMHLRDLFEMGDIDIPQDSKRLIAELAEIKKKHMSSGKMKIEDPAKSPDHADSAMLACLEVQGSKSSGGFVVTDL